MVNGPAPRDSDAAPAHAGGGRRARAVGAAPSFGQPKLNPFGDLPTLQHLSARAARLIRPAVEPLLRRELRCWAEPLAVQRFADYRAERGDGLTAWLPLPIAAAGAAEPAGAALAVLDGGFVLEVLDLFFGGTGAAPRPLPAEFSPAAEAVVERLGRALAGPLRTAWEPLARVDFAVGRMDPGGTPPAGIEADDAVVVTRFGLGTGDAGQGSTRDAAAGAALDILYPVAALKPFGAALTGKVVDNPEPDPAWRTALTRAAMGVGFPVRSVLAEPIVPLSRLMNLQVGDVIPLSIGATVPVFVGADRLGEGTVGTSNGRAAVQLTALNLRQDPDR